MKQTPLLAKLLAVAGFAPAPQAEDAKPAPEADVTQTAVPDLSAEVETLKASLVEAEGKLVAAQAEAAAMLEAKVHEIAAHADTIVADLTAQLTAAVERADALQATAAQRLAKERADKVLAVVGATRAPALVAATKDMDEAQFTAVIGALEASAVAEGKSKLFTEIGIDAEVKPAAVAEDEGENNGTMRILRAQFQPTK